MKKTIAILLVAIMAVGSVFAAFDANLTGKFTSKLAYDLQDNRLAFAEPDNKLTIGIELTGASENEGDLYAVAKGELSLSIEAKGEAGAGMDSYDPAQIKDDWKFEFTEVGIYGQGWNVSLLKAAEMPKYATGWETYNDGDDSVDLKAPVSYKNDIGLTVTIDNLLKAGVAMDINFNEDAPKNALAWVSTNDLNFAGVVVNGAVGVKKEAGSGVTYVGLGLEAGYENDTLSATVASDMSIGIPSVDEKDATFDFDVAANVNYVDMVTVDAYYASKTALAGDDAPVDTYQVASDSINRGFYGVSGGETIEDYLSAKVGFDMNAFDVPVKLTLAAMDLINNPYFDLEAYVEVAGFEITGFGGYQAMIYGTDEIQANNLHVGAKVAYTIEPVGKLSASTTFLTSIYTAEGIDPDNAMSLELALENTTLVTGATLKAGYKTANIIGGDNALMAQDKGEVYVSATIEF